MSRPGAVVVEEQAELADLRDQASRAANEAARTLAELGDRFAIAGKPGLMARRLAADGAAAATRALREVPGTLAGRRGVWRPALAAIPVLAIGATLVMLRWRSKSRSGS